ncbi:hypothetical protein Halha_1970 [Halobacteroides halobius DSM 5150]|uniref:Class IIb bacteriocin, lactobin A/cerein 7B family n=1 Tax=Halobacteroides halobius (strain ATCC 35273 / DSM 5150 / MD-1) TaxID=748449 RepID=L0KBY1_HALHC|nr:hypothetical protein [Halobacteroides halobius]AGB41869.1 hypothetical protein Halha_1970 [Halobacteroides halobius DSM 5150]
MEKLEEQELMNIDGGVAITTGGLIAGGLFVTGVGIGVAWALSD